MKNIVLVPNPIKAGADSVKEISTFISSLGCNVAIADYAPTLNSDEYKNTDLFVVLGGDGSIIDIAGYTAGMNIPIVGINFGNVGYLAQLKSDDYAKLEEIINGKADIQNRLLLDVSVIRDGKVIFTSKAINDAFFSNGPLVNLITFEIYTDGKWLEKIRSNSLVIATPTGSSAYSMSAGGPLLDPEIEAICITPVCPQKLNVRPCVISSDKIIEIKNIDCRMTTPILAVDGKEICDIKSTDIIRIEKSAFSLPLVSCDKRSFLEILYSKLTDKIDD